MDKKQEELIRKQMEKERAEFCQAIEKIVPKFKKEIEKKNTILVSIKDLAKDMGPKFESKSSFYWETKLCLWDKGIFVEPKRIDDEEALLMRVRTPKDKIFYVH